MSSTLERLRQQASSEAKVEKKQTTVKEEANNAEVEKKLAAKKKKADKEKALLVRAKAAKKEKSASKKIEKKTKSSAGSAAISRKEAEKKTIKKEPITFLRTQYLDIPKKEIKVQLEKNSKYFVTNQGRILSEKANGDMKQMVSLILGQYPTVDIRSGDKKLRIKIHELIADKFTQKLASAFLELNQEYKAQNS